MEGTETMRTNKELLKIMGLSVLEVMKSFWSASIIIMWAFIPLLVLQTYKIEMIEISLILTKLRIHLIRSWSYYWFAFFISNLWMGIKDALRSKNE